MFLWDFTEFTAKICKKILFLVILLKQCKKILFLVILLKQCTGKFKKKCKKPC